MSDLNAKHNRVVWMDIPVSSLSRAIKFYQGVLGIEVSKEAFNGFEFAVLAHDEGNGACLIPMPDQAGAKPGVTVYLNVDGRLRDACDKVKELGGQVTQDVHAIGPHGYRAFILDSEGNHFALHSDSDS